MRVEREKLGDWFIYGREVAWKYSLTSVGRPAARFSDLGLTIDGGMSLDWGGHYFGPPALKQRLVATQGYDLEPEQLFLANGTYEANYVAVMALVEKGDEVVLEAPPGPRSGVLCRAIGANVKVLRLREENRWKPDPDELRRLVTDRTKLVFINHPNNPTGSVLSSDDMERHRRRWRAGTGRYLLSDEIYRGLEWDGPLSPSAVNAYERGIVTSSLTKTLGMCGLRLGWVGSRDKEFLDRAFALHRYGVMVNDVFGEQPRRGGPRAGDLGPPPGGGEADRPPEPPARDRLDGAQLALQLGRPRAGRSRRFRASSCRCRRGTCAARSSASPRGRTSSRASATARSSTTTSAWDSARRRPRCRRGWPSWRCSPAR